MEWAGLSPHDMAREFDMSTNTIWNYLSGRTVPKRVIVLYWATVTGVDVDWLLRGITPGHDDHPTESTNRYSSHRLSLVCATTYADAA
jgi:transcriptional regulator with XRE-family HTH domain